MTAARQVFHATPTILGRIVLFSAMINDATGTYEPSLIGIPAPADPKLREFHQELILRWLSAATETQVSDAVEYFAASGNPEESARVLQPYAHLLPRNADPVHQQHFLETIPHVIALATDRLHR